MLTIRRFHDHQVDEVPVKHLHAALTQTGFLWVDVSAPTPEEEEVLDHERLAIEPTALRDIRENVHLPKLDVHDDEVVLTVHAIDLEPSTIEVRTVELDIIIKRRVVITYHRTHIPAVDEVARRLTVTTAGVTTPAQLVHRILDVTTDVFVPFADHLDRRLDLIEEDIMARPTEGTRRDIYALQRDVIQLRRIVVPQAEVVRRLRTEGVNVLGAEASTLFGEIYDHLSRIQGLSDSYHQLLSSALENYRGALNDELNNMFRVLTILSAVLLPVTFIAGVYGMNFVHMPELDEVWAYPAVLGLMFVIVVSELIWFRRKGWIGQRFEEERLERRRRLEELEIPVLGQVVRLPAYGARAVVSVGKGVGKGVFRGVGWLFRRRRRDEAPPRAGPT